MLLNITKCSFLKSSLFNTNFEKKKCLRIVYNNEFTTKLFSSNQCNKAFIAAEKLVGYPSSFQSLRWLLSDDVSNVATYLRRLMSSNHPLLKRAKNIITGQNYTMQTLGLIVILISRTALPLSQSNTDVIKAQKTLAEVTESIRISHLIHQGLVNLQPLECSGDDMNLYGNMTFGNKIALLSGDFLLGNACADLANMRNQQIVELMSSTVRDLAESEFIGDRDEQNNPLPSKPSNNQQHIACNYNLIDNMKPIPKAALGNMEKEWEMRNILSSANLLGKSCQGAMILSNQTPVVQNVAFDFGKHMALAWQARSELEQFESKDTVKYSFNLTSSPVLYHLAYDPSSYNDIINYNRKLSNEDYIKLHSKICSGPALKKTKLLIRHHTLSAMDFINYFPPSEYRTALHNIILAIKSN